MLVLPVRTGIETVLTLRVARFALVGAVGIPINMGFLWLFHIEARASMLMAWVMAFECSALINFYANQRFTYRDQTHVRGIEWLWRAIRAQISSISGVVVNAMLFGLLLVFGLHYLEADAGGIVAAFSCNFFIANRFVFTPSIVDAEAAAACPAGSARSDVNRLAKVGKLTAVEIALNTSQEVEFPRRSLGGLAPAEELA